MRNPIITLSALTIHRILTILNLFKYNYCVWLFHFLLLKLIDKINDQNLQNMVILYLLSTLDEILIDELINLIDLLEF